MKEKLAKIRDRILLSLLITAPILSCICFFKGALLQAIYTLLIYVALILTFMIIEIYK